MGGRGKIFEKCALFPPFDYTSKNLSAKQIWNCDESGFPSDPVNCKVVSEKGKVAYKVTCGSGRENTTTLAICSAAGNVLTPLLFSAEKTYNRHGGEKGLFQVPYMERLPMDG